MSSKNFWLVGSHSSWKSNLSAVLATCLYSDLQSQPSLVGCIVSLCLRKDSTHGEPWQEVLLRPWLAISPEFHTQTPATTLVLPSNLKTGYWYNMWKYVLFTHWNKMIISRNTDDRNINTALGGIKCELERQWPQMGRSLSACASVPLPWAFADYAHPGPFVSNCSNPLRWMSSGFRGNKPIRCSIKATSTSWHSGSSSIDEASRKPNENNTRKSLHQHPSLTSQCQLIVSSSLGGSCSHSQHRKLWFKTLRWSHLTTGPGHLRSANPTSNEMQWFWSVFIP